MVDAPVSGTGGLLSVEVRLFFWAPGGICKEGYFIQKRVQKRLLALYTDYGIQDVNEHQVKRIANEYSFL